MLLEQYGKSITRSYMCIVSICGTAERSDAARAVR